MSDCIKNCGKSLAHTFNSFVSGESIKNFENLDNFSIKKNSKTLTITASVVAAVGVGVLIGVIPVVGPMLAVPMALIMGLYVFARMTQPDRNFFSDDKFKKVKQDNI